MKRLLNDDAYVNPISHLFAAALISPLVTSARGFVQHVRMLRKGAELPLRNLYR